MTRLRQRDLTVFSHALSVLYADVSAGTLSDRILGSLRTLFDCDFASFSLLDLREGRFHAFAIDPVVSAWPGTETHQRHLPTDPAASYIKRTRRPQAVKISDFVSLRQYRNLSVYTEVFGPVGCDRRLGFADQSAGPVSLVSTLNRKGRDFSEEERTLLDLLRPHLLQANTHAHAGKRLNAAHARERARLADLSGAGLAELDAAGRVVWLTPRAETLLAEFFPAPARAPRSWRLPGELDRRLVPVVRQPLVTSVDEPRKPRRLIWEFAGPNGRVLRVRLVPHAPDASWRILLELIGGTVPVRQLTHLLKLTPREAEVLHWLAQGKTNWEIGMILDMAEKNRRQAPRKHLRQAQRWHARRRRAYCHGSEREILAFPPGKGRPTQAHTLMGRPRPDQWSDVNALPPSWADRAEVSGWRFGPAKPRRRASAWRGREPVRARISSCCPGI